MAINKTKNRLFQPFVYVAVRNFYPLARIIVSATIAKKPKNTIARGLIMRSFCLISLVLLAACSTPDGYHWCHDWDQKAPHLVQDSYHGAEEMGPHNKIWAHAIIADKEPQ